ncbi:MAG: hypothetical protein JW795_02230 [Chitinivibrionales bacterium]|nr:hypothetical protein [Chitinivibrionales bacterium]
MIFAPVASCRTIVGRVVIDCAPYTGIRRRKTSSLIEINHVKTKLPLKK